MMESGWRESIQKAYEAFLNYGHTRDWISWEGYPSQFYDQLVIDKFIAPDAYRDQMPRARIYLLNKLQKRITVELMRKKAAVTHGTDLKQNFNDGVMQREIDEVRSGQHESRIELLAKQYLVLVLFKKGKKLNKQSIYIEEKKY